MVVEPGEVELPHPADANVPVRTSTAEPRTTLKTRSRFRPEESTGGERISASLGDETLGGISPPASRSLTFTYDEVRVGPALVLSASGARGGTALAQANVSPSASPLAIAQACAGNGLTEAPIDIRIVAPRISG